MATPNLARHHYVVSLLNVMYTNSQNINTVIVFKSHASEKNSVQTKSLVPFRLLFHLPISLVNNLLRYVLKAKRDGSLAFELGVSFLYSIFKYKPMLFSQSGDSHTLSRVDSSLFKKIVCCHNFQCYHFIIFYFLWCPVPFGKQ